MIKGSKLLAVVALVLVLLSVAVSASETNEILINEFVVDPQTDWGGGGVISSSDEWIELYNPGSSSKIIDGWKLNLIDSEISNQTLTGTIPAGGYLVILNPNGQQNNDGRIEIYDSNNNLIDSVSYGNYNDGNTNDNALNGNSGGVFDECLSRSPNGINTDVDSSDFSKTLCTYGSSNNFTFTPVHINDLGSQPVCALSSDNVTVSAEISGSIEAVILALNLGESWQNISLNASPNGIYSYRVLPSQLPSSENIYWQFIVRDLTGSTSYGSIESAYINTNTRLIVSPENPDGLNGWFVSRPVFELVNSDSNQIDYRWDGGSVQFYTDPFGLEEASNNANLTGGTHQLSYSSDVCDEREKQILVKFDFTDPEIQPILPTPNSVYSGSSPALIRTHIDEVYQGNSGVNLGSVRMFLDGTEVDANVTADGSVDAEVDFNAELSEGEHTVEIYAEDRSGRNTQRNWTFIYVETGNFNLNINQPQQIIYSDKRVPFNITLSQMAEEVSYVNNNEAHPTYKILCRNCEGYGFDQVKFKTVQEGLNELNFRAVSLNGEVSQRSTQLVVDSKEPKIKKIFPTAGFTTGEFSVEFEEENPQVLMINYGNNEIGFRSHVINITNDCIKNGKYHCNTNLDLSDYDETRISYSFYLLDIAGNSDESDQKILEVDFSPPMINSFDFSTNGKFVTFRIETSELFLEEITYIDMSESNPKEKRLCISVEDGVCEKTVSFGEGQHEVFVKVKDSAGGSAEAEADFLIDSKLPKIKETAPARGFASGNFTATIEEVNPRFLFLNYGANGDQRTSQVDLDNCSPDRKNLVCKINVNLSDFEGETIIYSFNLTDVNGNTATSTEKSLSVDTMPPRINSFNYTTASGRRVTFSMIIDEENFDKIIYLDRGIPEPRYSPLCSKLEGNLCEKTLTFRAGDHLIDILAVDKAGNERAATDRLSFSF